MSCKNKEASVRWCCTQANASAITMVVINQGQHHTAIAVLVLVLVYWYIQVRLQLNQKPLHRCVLSKPWKILLSPELHTQIFLVNKLKITFFLYKKCTQTLIKAILHRLSSDYGSFEVDKFKSNEWKQQQSENSINSKKSWSTHGYLTNSGFLRYLLCIVYSPLTSIVQYKWCFYFSS